MVIVSPLRIGLWDPFHSWPHFMAPINGGPIRSPGILSGGKAILQGSTPPFLSDPDNFIGPQQLEGPFGDLGWGLDLLEEKVGNLVLGKDVYKMVQICIVWILYMMYNLY